LNILDVYLLVCQVIYIWFYFELLLRNNIWKINWTFQFYNYKKQKDKVNSLLLYLNKYTIAKSKYL